MSCQVVASFDKFDLPLGTDGHVTAGFLVKIGRDRAVRPWSWTVSCGGFDRLPGVVILELCWAQVA